MLLPPKNQNPRSRVNINISLLHDSNDSPAFGLPSQTRVFRIRCSNFGSTSCTARNEREIGEREESERAYEVMRREYGIGSRGRNQAEAGTPCAREKSCQRKVGISFCRRHFQARCHISSSNSSSICAPGSHLFCHMLLLLHPTADVSLPTTTD
jgi:hypothetical protein